ncbi:type 1 glutamine amidotransferase [Pinisolibacter aquiterrae]|uniref:type 1 glutamine amidotransferase n=1 Tax=Pinisolibacter aquiterrae TaxID=2815579 RepID=UPI001C3CAB48|nr:type 1 glutamine amidotransferase [Pinisolibacter aquiterrae]MBV5265846.1 type 1 glutamine amidotransferase [Pinisolibacter aquiterrae]MCC8236589.1 type 1 glutamine amidotransferase [Pinisolibacter aquiterrae]
MPRLLYLVNGSRRETASRLPDMFREAGLEVDLLWAFAGEFPEDLGVYDGIFLSGSAHGAYEDVPFIHREHDLIREAADRDIPMLGICFGHQILASALCDRDQVFRRSFCEVGYKWLPTTDAARLDPLACELGDAVRMFVWHNDEVRADHPDMVVLAASDLCPNHVWRHRRHRAWGIQGHPEVTRDEAVVWFEQSRARLELDGAVIADLQATADDALPAKTMLARFARLVAGATVAP